jgi:predicted TIM-barrel fold metal-dependent hydrolase
MLIDVNTCFGKTPKKRVDWSPDKLMELLLDGGVDCALTYSLRGVLYDFVTGNDETWEVCSRYDMLIPVATVDPRRHFGCLDEIERCADRGFPVFRFFPDLQGWTVDSAPFLKICEVIAEYDVSVMLPAGPAGHQSLVGRTVAPFGFNVVMMGAGYGVNAETYAVCAAYDNIFAETHSFASPGTLEGLAWVAGAHKLMFGSNSPDRYFGAALTMVESADLSDTDRAAVLGENALRYLRLGGGGSR